MERRPPIVPCDAEACLAARLAGSVFPMFNRMFSQAVSQELISEEDACKVVNSINEVDCDGYCMRLEMAGTDLRNTGYFEKNQPSGGYEKKGRSRRPTTNPDQTPPGNASQEDKS